MFARIISIEIINPHHQIAPIQQSPRKPRTHKSRNAGDKDYHRGKYMGMRRQCSAKAMMPRHKPVVALRCVRAIWRNPANANAKPTTANTVKIRFSLYGSNGESRTVMLKGKYRILMRPMIADATPYRGVRDKYVTNLSTD
jgi:hypothetical protein